MCLSGIEWKRKERFKSRPKRTVIRYKVVRRGLGGVIGTAYIGTTLTQDWREASDTILADEGWGRKDGKFHDCRYLTYPSGFHVFKTIKEAKRWMRHHNKLIDAGYEIIIEVECAGLLTKGFEFTTKRDLYLYSAKVVDVEVYQYMRLTKVAE